MSYDIRPAMDAMAAIVRNALKPGSLNEVYTNIPDMQSISAPVMFFDYTGTVANEQQTYTGYDRVFKVDAVAFVGLAVAMDLTDQRTKQLIGEVYDLFAPKPNRTLGGLCAECRITGDDSVSITALGRIVYGAVVFHFEITDYVVIEDNC